MLYRGNRLTSDYLKQLQLTKQLEQKTKDAAKLRKGAEDKLAEAERAVAAALSMGADVREAQRALTEGRAAFGKKDYSLAAGAGENARSLAEKMQTSMVGDVLGSVDSFLAMIDEAGEERQGVEDILNAARQAMTEGRGEEALTAARGALEAAKKFADHHITGMFAQVKRSIDLAEKEGIATAAKRQALAKAVKVHGEGNLEDSLTRLAACYKSVHESFSKLIGERSTSLLEAAEQVAVGGDTSPVSIPVGRAQECLARGQFEEAMFLLGEGQKALSPLLSTSVQDRLSEQVPRSYWLREQGVSISRFATASKKASEAAKASQSEDALEWLRRAEKALRDGEAEAVLKSIEDLRPRLLVARRFGLDIAPQLAALEDARQEAGMGRGREAVELVSRASEALDRHLDQISELEEELEQTREAFLEAKAMRAVSPSAGDMVQAAREAALSGRLADALGSLTQAQEVLLGTVLQRVGPRLLDDELMVAAGLSMGAAVDDESKALEEIEEDLRDGYLKGITDRLRSIGTALEAALMSTARLAVVEAEQVTSIGQVGVNLQAVREKVKRSRDLLDGREWRAAFSLAKEAVDEAKAVTLSSLGTLREQTVAILDIGRRLGIDPQTLELWSSAMSSDDSEPTEALRSLVEIYNHARMQVKDEMARSYATLIRSSSSAHRKGVSTAHVDQLAEEGSKALSSFELEASFAKLQAAEKELEKTSALHNEVYDLIVLLSRLTSEIQVPAGSKVQPLLVETKRLFEAGLYEGARTSARSCYREAETIGAHILFPRKMQELQQLLPVARQIGPELVSVDEELAATADLMKRDPGAAMAQLGDIQKRLTDHISKGIQSEIGELRKALDRDDLGREEIGSLAVVEKAESLLADQRFGDALRAVRFARSETVQVVSVMQAAQQELLRVEGVLDDMTALEYDVREARSLLEQARRYRSSGRFNIVTEMARRAEHSACLAAGEQVRRKLEAMEKEVDVGPIAGRDLEELRTSMLASVTDLVERRRYEDAQSEMVLYRQRLQGLRSLQDGCSTALSQIRERTSPVPPGSLLLVEARKLQDQAQDALEHGELAQCWSLMTPCQVSADAALRWHQGCSRRCQEVKVKVLERGGADLAALMDSAGKELAAGNYESMNRYLLHAERAFHRERSLEGRRNMADLVNLARLFSFLGLTLKDLPAEAMPLLDRRLDELVASDLRKPLAIVQGTVRKAVEARASKVKAAAKKGGSGAVMGLIKEAETSLADGRLDRAVGKLREAEIISEATVEQVLELRALYHRYEVLDALASSRGIPDTWSKEHRASFTSKNMSTALKHMRAAMEALQRATAEHLPRLVVSASAISNAGASPALDLVLDGSAGERVTLWPRSSVALPPRKKGAMTLRYRALFMAQPFTEVLEKS